MTEHKQVETIPMAGREPGVDTLECKSCGRFWGGDDIAAAKGFDPKDVVGRCPICEGMVYPK